MYTCILKSFLSLVWELPKQTDSCYPISTLSRLNLSRYLLVPKSCPRVLHAECVQIFGDHFEATSRQL